MPRWLVALIATVTVLASGLAPHNEGPPLNGATTLLPTVASWMGLSSASNKIRYTVASTNILPSVFALTDWIMAENNVDLAWAPWHPWQPAVNSGAFHPQPPGQSVVSQLSVNLANNSAHGSPRGWMIVALDDPSGAGQADLVPFGALT